MNARHLTITGYIFFIKDPINRKTFMVPHNALRTDASFTRCQCTEGLTPWSKSLRSLRKHLCFKSADLLGKALTCRLHQKGFSYLKRDPVDVGGEYMGPLNLKYDVPTNLAKKSIFSLLYSISYELGMGL